MRHGLWMFGLGLAGVLAGCGDTALEQGATGAAVGGVAGEVIADEPLVGAGIGAGAGVLAGEIDDDEFGDDDFGDDDFID